MNIAPFRPCLPCGRAFYNGILPSGLPFCDQKGSEKVSLLRGSALGGQNDGRHPAELARSCGSKPHRGFDRCATPQPRLRGYSPLRTPKVWSKNPKAKKCRNDCIFLNAFGSFSRLTPSGPKILYTHTVGADACHRPAGADTHLRGDASIAPYIPFTDGTVGRGLDPSMGTPYKQLHTSL